MYPRFASYPAPKYSIPLFQLFRSCLHPKASTCSLHLPIFKIPRNVRAKFSEHPAEAIGGGMVLGFFRCFRVPGFRIGVLGFRALVISLLMASGCFGVQISMVVSWITLVWHSGIESLGFSVVSVCRPHFFSLWF